MILDQIGQTYHKFKFDPRPIQEAWEKTGLLKGLKGDRKEAVAVLLESQANEIVDKLGLKALQEATLTGTTAITGASDNWVGMGIPLIRRAWGRLIAPDIFSVQAIPIPTWKIFYLDTQYGSNRPTMSSADAGYNETPTENSSWYGSIVNEGIQGSGGGVYSTYNFGYTRNWISQSVASASVTVVSSASISDRYLEYNYTAAEKANILELTIDLTSVPYLDEDTFKMTCIGDFTSSASFTPSAVLRQYTRLVYSGGVATQIVFYVKSTADTGNVFSASFSAYYQRKTDFDYRGDFEYGQTNVSRIPEMNIKITSKNITAKTRKMKAYYSWEEMHDIWSYQSVDLEKLITEKLAEAISLELDRTMLYDCLARTETEGTNMWWSKKMGQFTDLQSGSTLASPTSYYHTEQQWYQTLVPRISAVSNEIYRKTNTGGATWIVTSPWILTILENLPFQQFKRTEKKEGPDNGIKIVGKLNGMDVYIDPYFPASKMLLGRKGSDKQDAGYIYAPNLPLEVIPTVLDPAQELRPLKAVYTRDAFSMVRPEYYGTITVREYNTI